MITLIKNGTVISMDLKRDKQFEKFARGFMREQKERKRLWHLEQFEFREIPY